MGTELTADEAAELLGVTPRHVRWYYSRGLLPARTIGKNHLLFRRMDIERFEKPKKTGRRRTSQGKQKGASHAD